jgi:hypothetical protein
MTESAMTRYFLTSVALLALTGATFAAAASGEAKKPTTAPAPSQHKSCCVDSKGHYRADWQNGVNCPHNHKYCK